MFPIFPAHLATAHSLLLGKHGSKLVRSLDLNFNLPARSRPSRSTAVEPVFAREEPQVDTGDVAQFPSLNGATTTTTTTTGGLRSAATWSGRLNRVVEEFPALSLEGKAPAHAAPLPPPVRGPLWGAKQVQLSKGPRSSASVATVEDFPTLSAATPSSSSSSSNFIL